MISEGGLAADKYDEIEKGASSSRKETEIEIPTEDAQKSKFTYSFYFKSPF